MNTTPRGRPAKPQTANRLTHDENIIEPIPDAEDVVVTDPGFILELSIGGELFKSSAPTVLEALENLERPQKIITKGTITVRHGSRKKELFFMPMAMKRIFYPLARVPMAKMLGMNM